MPTTTPPRPFTHAVAYDVDLKQVVNTNKALLHVARHGGMLHIVSVIDNLLKGSFRVRPWRT